MWKSLMAKWLEQASQWHEMYCRDLEVMSSNPSWVEFGVCSTSVLSRNWSKNIISLATQSWFHFIHHISLYYFEWKLFVSHLIFLLPYFLTNRALCGAKMFTSMIYPLLWETIYWRITWPDATHLIAYMLGFSVALDCRGGKYSELLGSPKISPGLRSPYSRGSHLHHFWLISSFNCLLTCPRRQWRNSNPYSPENGLH